MNPRAASPASLNLSWIGMPYSLRYCAKGQEVSRR
jgi:hypothetical protein